MVVIGVLYFMWVCPGRGMTLAGLFAVIPMYLGGAVVVYGWRVIKSKINLGIYGGGVTGVKVAIGWGVIGIAIGYFNVLWVYRGALALDLIDLSALIGSSLWGNIAFVFADMIEVWLCLLGLHMVSPELCKKIAG
ncbi:MAG: hypothetical protein J7L96_08800 [Bacteroidales bacterium]|nr:hypothetical protein [Bacteroidales bacterium]